MATNSLREPVHRNSDKKTEDLRQRRMQEEVSKARMMLEIVGDQERKELEAMFPELLDSPSRSQRSDFFLDDANEDVLPKAYVYMGPELVETPITGGDTEIDFGLTGCRIPMRDFVGLRPLHTFSKVPALPANYVPEKAPSPAERAKKLATNLGESVKDTWQWIADKKPFGLELPSPQKVLRQQDPVVVLTSNGLHPAEQPQVTTIHGSLGAATPYPSESMRPIGLGAGQPIPAAATSNGHQTAEEVNGVSRDGSGSSQDPHSHLGKWEIVWKDHSTAKVPIRRLEFACNAAGLAAIREKMASWQQLATSAAAMLEASQAAVKANGGVIPQNPGIWLPPGVPDSVTEYFSKEREAQDRELISISPKEAASRALEPAVESLSISEPPDTPTGDRGVLTSPGGMTPSDMAAAGVVEGENVIRWGSVAVAGKHLPKKTGDSLILRPGHFMALAAALPARLRTAQWHLVYSTARDGISLATMYRKLASRRGPCVLIIRDNQKYVFGSFTSEEWKPSTKYYGNGESFVFQVQPLIQAFKWTHSNSYFMFSTPNSLAIGGGNHYAFSLNSDLLSGSSGPCETFGSLPLAGSEDFEAVLVECWSLR